MGPEVVHETIEVGESWSSISPVELCQVLELLLVVPKHDTEADVEAFDGLVHESTTQALENWDDSHEAVPVGCRIGVSRADH